MSLELRGEVDGKIKAAYNLHASRVRGFSAAARSWLMDGLDKEAQQDEEETASKG